MKSVLPLRQIINANLDQVLHGEQQPILLACIRQDERYPELIHMLENIAHSLSDHLAVCFATDELVPLFMERYTFDGTPTFLILSHGRIQGSLLGMTSTTGLIRFTQETLTQHAHRGRSGA